MSYELLFFITLVSHARIPPSFPPHCATSSCRASISLLPPSFSVPISPTRTHTKLPPASAFHPASSSSAHQSPYFSRRLSSISQCKARLKHLQPTFTLNQPHFQAKGPRSLTCGLLLISPPNPILATYT